MPRGSLRCLRKKYVVAGPLESLVQPGESLERKAVHAVEVHAVLLDRIVRREVHAAAEPPYRILSSRREEPHVHVHRRHVRIARMQHERDAHRLPRAPGELRPRRRGRGRQLRPGDVREAHAGALEKRAILDDPRDAPAALGALPFVRAGTPCRRYPRVARRCAAAGRGGSRGRRWCPWTLNGARTRGGRCPCGTACRRSGCARRPRRRARRRSSPCRRARSRTARARRW